MFGNQKQPCIQQVHPGSSTVPNLPFFGDGLYQDTQTVVINPLIQSGIAKHETDPLNDSDASRYAKSGKLFEILSLIFQALEGPHTANLRSTMHLRYRRPFMKFKRLRVCVIIRE